MTDTPSSPGSGMFVDSSASWESAYFETMSDALLALDMSTGAVVGGNPAFWRLLGYNRETLTGAHFSALLPPATTNPNTPVERRFALTGDVSEAELFHHADGYEVPCDVLATAVRTPTAELAVLHLRDARQREAQRQSRLANDRAALAAEKAEDVVRAVEQYMSHVSHELRTPLAVILSSSSMLEKYYARLGEEKREEHFGRIQAQVKYLTEFLDNLRFLSRLNAGQVQPRPDTTDVLTMLQEMIDEFTGHTQRPIFEMNTGGPLEALHLDGALWRRALMPLLHNAVKYGPPDGTVHLSVTRSADALETVVRDHGQGLPADYLARPFEVFRRGDNSREVHGGGLGLAIAWRCAKLLGGSLTFETNDGAGSTFKLIVPL